MDVTGQVGGGGCPGLCTAEWRVGWTWPAESRAGEGHHPSRTLRQAQHARGPLSNVGEPGEGCSLRIGVRVPGLIGSWSDGEKHATMTLRRSGQ